MKTAAGSSRRDAAALGRKSAPNSIAHERLGWTEPERADGQAHHQRYLDPRRYSSVTASGRAGVQGGHGGDERVAEDARDQGEPVQHQHRRAVPARPRPGPRICSSSTASTWKISVIIAPAYAKGSPLRSRSHHSAAVVVRARGAPRGAWMHAAQARRCPGGARPRTRGRTRERRSPRSRAASPRPSSRNRSARSETASVPKRSRALSSQRSVDLTDLRTRSIGEDHHGEPGDAVVQRAADPQAEGQGERRSARPGSRAARPRAARPASGRG